MLTPAGFGAVAAAWPDIAGALSGIEPRIDPWTVADRLRDQTLMALRVSGRANGWVLISIAKTRDTHVQAMWVYLAAGRIGNRAAAKEVVAILEGMARSVGCVEIRAEITRLSLLRLLPGWERIGMVKGRHVIRKRLNDG